MSMWKSDVVELILNEIVSPLVTLCDVAKPWISASPAPSICHVLGSAPGSEFSHATGLATGGVQASAWLTAGMAAPNDTAAQRVARPANSNRETDWRVRAPRGIPRPTGRADENSRGKDGRVWTCLVQRKGTARGAVDGRRPCAAVHARCSFP